MSLRILEAHLPSEADDEVEALLSEHAVLDAHIVVTAGGRMHRVTVDSTASEGIVDALRSRFGDVRITILAAEATLPRDEAPGQDGDGPEGTPVGPAPSSSPARISRDELYEDITARIRLDGPFLATVVVSAVVAVVGLVTDDIVAIIGAMVIAPLLGPNVALALATTLGDRALGWKALRTGGIGIGLSFAIAVGAGAFLTVDANGAQIAARTEPSLASILLALASGIAGGLAFTTGVPASVVGVMVAVALLPPLATGGLLLGSGQRAESVGAFLLLAANLIAVNLAGVATFLAQGIRPLFWSDQARARRAARRALVLWTLLLAALAWVVWSIQADVIP